MHEYNPINACCTGNGHGSAQTVLFAFLLAGIAGQETGLLQNAAEGRIKKKQSTAVP